MCIVLNGIYPFSPTAPRLRFRPCAVGLKHTVETNHPGCHLDIDEGYVFSEEEWSFFVGGIDELANLRLEFFCILDLIFRILFL